MNKILLMDAFSTIHVGNGALLENTIDMCKKAYPDAEIHIMTADIRTNKERYINLHNTMFGNFSVDKNNYYKGLWVIRQLIFMLLQILNEYTFKVPSDKLTFDKDKKHALNLIDESDICVSLGGEMIGDTFYKTLPFWLFNFWIAIKKNKKFILFPQSVGPLKKGWARKLTFLALNNATLLAGRDKASYETLISIGLNPEKVMYVPDVAIQQNTIKVDINKYFNLDEKKVVGVTISKPPYREMGIIVDFVKELSDELKKFNPDKYKFLIMPSNYIHDGISADYSLCLELKKSIELSHDVEILDNRPYFPDEYTGLLSELELFISTRMHVAILSTSIATPTIAINTQHKIRGYMKNIDMEKFCVDYNDLKNIFELSQTLIQDRNKIVSHLEDINNKLRKYHDIFLTKII